MKGIDKEWVELIQRIGSLQGIDTLMSSIFAIVYIEPEMIAMDDLAKKTGYSLASISNKTKTMEQMGLIIRKKVPGSRKVYLSMEKDMTKTIRDLLLKKEMAQVNMIKDNLPGIISKYKKDSKSGKDDEMKKKVELAEKYLRFTKQYEQLINKMIAEIDSLR